MAVPWGKAPLHRIHDDASTPTLLLSDLIRDAVDTGWQEGSVTGIMRRLLESDVTDAERAGERLLVFGWDRERRAGTLVWEYRVVGEESGWEHVRFSLAVHGDGGDGPLAVLGLQLQIAL